MEPIPCEECITLAICKALLHDVDTTYTGPCYGGINANTTDLLDGTYAGNLNVIYNKSLGVYYKCSSIKQYLDSNYSSDKVMSLFSIVEEGQYISLKPMINFFTDYHKRWDLDYDHGGDNEIPKI